MTTMIGERLATCPAWCGGNHVEGEALPVVHTRTHGLRITSLPPEDRPVLIDEGATWLLGTVKKADTVGLELSQREVDGELETEIALRVNDHAVTLSWAEVGSFAFLLQDLIKRAESTQEGRP